MQPATRTHPETGPLRYQDFPSGLGKGHDAAIVGAWLSDFLEHFDVTKVEPCKLLARIWLLSKV